MGHIPKGIPATGFTNLASRAGTSSRATAPVWRALHWPTRRKPWLGSAIISPPEEVVATCITGSPYSPDGPLTLGRGRCTAEGGAGTAKRGHRLQGGGPHGTTDRSTGKSGRAPRPGGRHARGCARLGDAAVALPHTAQLQLSRRPLSNACGFSGDTTTFGVRCVCLANSRDEGLKGRCTHPCVHVPQSGTHAQA